MRCAIYARFSSDRQSATSAEDQIALCRQRAEREGWTVAGVYADRAISGADIRRPQMTALLASLAEGSFDIVLTEALDRIARDQEDIARIYKRVAFAGARLVTIADGEVSELHIGFKGTMDAVELKKIAEKTRRGQRGSLGRGHIPGGLAYGYALAPRVHDDGRVELGLRRIVEEQAAIVRRVFAEYVAGRSTRAIARDLNAEGIPSPRGGLWRSSVISGSGPQQTGILANPIYVGRFVWNRRRWLRDPETRNRQPRRNDPADRLEIALPELRIVDDVVWEAAQRIRGQSATQPVHQRRRPRHFLSQLVKCRACGGNYVLQDRSRWGCSGHKETGVCRNGHRILVDELERRVLAGLQDQLLSPEAVAVVVREYHREAARAAQRGAGAREAAAKRLRTAEASIERLTAAIADGGGTFAALRDALARHSAERDAASAELAEHDALPVIALHPKIADAYRDRIRDLAASLKRGEVTADSSAGQIRSLIDRITINPRADGTAEIEVFGSLARIIAMAGGPPGRGEPAHREWLVAGTGFEPVTFRL